MENEIIIKKTKSVFKSPEGSNMHFFSSNNIGITDILQYVKESGIDKYPRCMITSWDMACEGLTYGSHYPKNINESNYYHVTHIISQLPKTTSCADSYQFHSRVNGNHADNINPTLYLTESTRVELQKFTATFNAQQKILESKKIKSHYRDFFCFNLCVLNVVSLLEPNHFHLHLHKMVLIFHRQKQ